MSLLTSLGIAVREETGALTAFRYPQPFTPEQRTAAESWVVLPSHKATPLNHREHFSRVGLMK